MATRAYADLSQNRQIDSAPLTTLFQQQVVRIEKKIVRQIEKTVCELAQNKALSEKVRNRQLTLFLRQLERETTTPFYLSYLLEYRAQSQTIGDHTVGVRRMSGTPRSEQWQLERQRGGATKKPPRRSSKLYQLLLAEPHSMGAPSNQPPQPQQWALTGVECALARNATASDSRAHVQHAYYREGQNNDLVEAARDMARQTPQELILVAVPPHRDKRNLDTLRSLLDGAVRPYETKVVIAPVMPKGGCSPEPQANRTERIITQWLQRNGENDFLVK